MKNNVTGNHVTIGMLTTIRYKHNRCLDPHAFIGYPGDLVNVPRWFHQFDAGATGNKLVQYVPV